MAGQDEQNPNTHTEVILLERNIPVQEQHAAYEKWLREEFRMPETYRITYGGINERGGAREQNVTFTWPEGEKSFEQLQREYFQRLQQQQRAGFGDAVSLLQGLDFGPTTHVANASGQHEGMPTAGNAARRGGQHLA